MQYKEDFKGFIGQHISHVLIAFPNSITRPCLPAVWNAFSKLKSNILLQSNFLPDVVTQAVGRELAKTSFLGPFLSVSVFAEDEAKVADKFFSGNPVADKSLNQTLQQELENTRVWPSL